MKIWEIPSEYSESASIIKEPLVVLEGNSKKVTFTRFNAVVDNLLATASNDGTVACFDVAKQKAFIKVDCKDMCQSLEWDLFGNALCGVFKDKVVRVLDPRHNVVALESPNSHKGNKAAKAVWLSNRGQPTDSGTYIASCGFSNQTKREMFLWDTRNFSEPCWTNVCIIASGLPRNIRRPLMTTVGSFTPTLTNAPVCCFWLAVGMEIFGIMNSPILRYTT